MANDLNISKLNKEIEKLKAYDSATQGLHGDATSQMERVVQKINSIFSKPLFANGRYDYSGIDMKWANGLIKRWDDYKAEADNNYKEFTLPSEQKDEIDKIINSDSSWEEKAEKIRRVYESYLFENVKDQNGNNPFLAYAAELNKYDGDTTVLEMQDPENQLGIILQNSGINIRSVTRALSEDLLKIMPQDVNIVNKTFNFVNLVQTGAPADLKNNALDGSGNANNSDQYSFDFSIWSRKWEPNMSSDYLGNYGFGYIGADYWQGFDFDDAVDSISRLNDSISDYHNSNNNDIYLALIRSGVEFFRDGNPDKTDAEIFCRVGAGIAQLKSDDFNVKKYIENVKNGNWGDNVGDSEMIGEGFNAYYNVHGIDKAQTIKEERK